MKYLIDTNIWLEHLLDQERADEAERVLQEVPTRDQALTEFSLLSIGIKLLRHKRIDDFKAFLGIMAPPAGVEVLRHAPEDLAAVADSLDRLQLDFDDAYQYLAAEAYDLRIVSYDADFDRTPRGRITPARVLATLKKERS